MTRCPHWPECELGGCRCDDAAARDIARRHVREDRAPRLILLALQLGTLAAGVLAVAVALALGVGGER